MNKEEIAKKIIQIINFKELKIGEIEETIADFVLSEIAIARAEGAEKAARGILKELTYRQQMYPE
jgi:hypothetical protein